ncbi:MAG: hypothetical protein V2I26_08825 [Halieaceae bacterium]|jgi:methyl-accepting chemotaxis protein|nr:hypothetical protein [Halieaceae bacterium]
MENRRKKILINPRFQQQYAIISVVLTVILTNVLIIFMSLVPGEQALELSPAMAWGIGIFELVLLVGVWFGTIRASHKVAGPVYKFTQQLKALGAGEVWTRIALRQGDMFQAEADSINASLDQLQEKVQAVQDAAKAIQLSQSDGGPTAAQIEKLMAATGALRTAREG